MGALPEGTVAFLFTDVEGSTKLLESGRTGLSVALASHHGLLAQAIEHAGGVVFETIGDAAYAAFGDPAAAVRAAIDGQRALAGHPWDAAPLRVRMAVHAGPVERRGSHYFGEPLFRCQRIQSLAHGEQILVSDEVARATNGSLPDGVRLEDLGRHRLKDLTSIEHVFQVAAPGLRSTFPPLRSIGARPHNLPLELPPLLGRADELEAVAERLARARLVTIVGPGGIGKTRFSLEAAASAIEAFSAGVFFVDLSAALDESVAVSTIASVLGLGEADRGSLEALEEHLRPLEILLVLDNLEQLATAGRLVSRLLTAAPTLRILATSRVPVGVRSEHLVELPTLVVESPEAESPAVTLFIERARQANATFADDTHARAAIVEICRRLDGLPLAIELAAARTRTLPPEAMLPRLEQRLPLLTSGAADLPERHRAMSSTIAWSVELLNDAERTAFRRLSVFSGGAALSDVEAIVPAADEELAILDLIDSLVRHSLVRPVGGAAADDPRYAMLETIREYGLAQARAHRDLDGVRDRHFRRYLERLQHFRALDATEERRRLMDRLEVDHDNIRAAIRWLDESERWDDLLEMVSVAALFWSRHGHTTEGRRWIARALEKAPDGDPTARARIQVSAWSLHLAGGTPEEANEAIREAVALYEVGGPERELGVALALLGNNLQVQGVGEEARGALERAVEIAERLGDQVGRRRALNSLAVMLLVDDDLEAGEGSLTELFEQAVRDDDLGSQAVTGTDLAGTRYSTGMGDPETPARAAVDASRRSGSVDGWPHSVLGIALCTLGKYDEARRCFAESLEITMRRGQRVVLSLLFEGWGVLEARTGDAAIAAQCLAASEKLIAEFGLVPLPFERRFTAAHVAMARERLPEPAFGEAWERGLHAEEGEVIEVIRSRIDG